MFTRPLIPILLAFMSGIFLGHTVPRGTGEFILPAVLCVTALVLLCFFLSPRLKAACILALFFLSGILVNLGCHQSSLLLPLARKRRAVVVEGTLVEPVQVIGNSARLKVRSRTVVVNGTPIRADGKLQVTVYRETPRLFPGDKIRFPANLKPFRNFMNPGAFDYVSSMKAKGFVCSATVSDGRYVVPMGSGATPFPYSAIETLRRPIRRLMHQELTPEDDAILSALILGERQDMGPGLREPFLRTGLGHILAVSGLHIGLIAWITFFFFKWLLTRSYRLILRINVRKWTAFLTCFPVIAYACLAGFQVSCQRAMIMALVFFASVILDREKDVWSTLALAALIVLALDPTALFSITFQLSFGAVLGILWLTSPFMAGMAGPLKSESAARRLFKRIKIYLLGLACICLTAQLFLLPVTVYYFHRISPVAVFANMTAIPFLGLWILPAGLLSTLIVPLSPYLALVFLRIGASGLHGMMTTIRFWSQLPFSSLWMVTPNAVEIGLFYALLFCALFIRRWAWVKKALMVLCAVVLLDVGYGVYSAWFQPRLRVTYLDVGQGNSALVEFPGGKRMLIDGGGFPGSTFDVGRNVVAPFLWQSRIRNIDYMVMSHPQADHMNGLVFIAEAFHPKEFWYNGDQTKSIVFKHLMEVLSSGNVRLLSPKDLYPGRNISGVNVEVLHPADCQAETPGGKRVGDLNERSMVLKLTYQGESFLFPGDIEHQGEDILLRRLHESIRTRVLLSPHHGSGTSASVKFLKEVAPEICVISCGENRRLGFPHRITLERLKAIGCRILRTDRDGAIQFTVSRGQEGLGLRTFGKGWESQMLGWKSKGSGIQGKKEERDGASTPPLS